MKRLIILLLFFNVCLADVHQSQLPQIKRKEKRESGHLSNQEKIFASKLSPLHRSLFCRHFSVVQRIETMTLSDGLVQTIGCKQIIPDEAVEMIMKNARLKPKPASMLDK